MNWQQVLSLVVVALAALLLIRDRIRRWRRARTSPCGGTCTCASPVPKPGSRELRSAELSPTRQPER